MSCVLNPNNSAVTVCDRQSVWRGQCTRVLNPKTHTCANFDVLDGVPSCLSEVSCRDLLRKSFLLFLSEKQKERQHPVWWGEAMSQMTNTFSPFVLRYFPSDPTVSSHSWTVAFSNLRSQSKFSAHPNKGLTIFCWSSRWQKYWQFRWVLGLYLSFFLQNVFNSFAIPLKGRSFRDHEQWTGEFTNSSCWHWTYSVGQLYMNWGLCYTCKPSYKLVLVSPLLLQEWEQAGC